MKALISLALLAAFGCGSGAPDIDGEYRSDFGDITFTTDGQSVTAIYRDGGKLTGNLIGDSLEFNWSEPSGKRGVGYFIVHDAGRVLKGKWRYDDSRVWDGSWVCRKKGQ